MKIIFDEKISYEDKSLLEELVSLSVLKSKSYLDLLDIVIKLEIDRDQVIPEWGVGGCINKDRIEIFIEEGRKIDWKTYLPRTVFHELHHLGVRAFDWTVS